MIGLEKLAHHISVHAYSGILNRQIDQAGLFWVLANEYFNRSRVGEFDRVREEVEQNLLKPLLVRVDEEGLLSRLVELAKFDGPIHQLRVNDLADVLH